MPFLPFVARAAPARARARPGATSALDELRSINAYHLFAQMTLVRREPVIEGSDDGTDWQPYELRYEPGDVDRAPPFVAPHQPRVDFQMWFLLLGRGLARWFQTLLDRMRHDPAAVAPLFARNPFPDAPPRLVRIAVYRYRFTDAATRAPPARGGRASSKARRHRSDDDEAQVTRLWPGPHISVTRPVSNERLTRAAKARSAAGNIGPSTATEPLPPRSRAYPASARSRS